MRLISMFVVAACGHALTTALRIQAPPIVWKYEPMPDEQHLTIYPRAALRGIRWTFAAPAN